MSKKENLRILSYWFQSSIFTSLVDEEYDTSATEDASEDDTNVLPEPITSLFDPCSLNYSEAELRETCSKSFTGYCEDNSQVIFDHLTNVTLTQALNKNWKLHRLGRITASNFHEACHLKLDSECRSFVEKIMGYKKFFSTAATRYGTENENKAREEYKKEMVKYHHNFELKPTGLHINEKFPQLGASPDGFIYCDCHGQGILEIKCPHKYKDGFEKCENDKNFPLDLNSLIKINHEYYYQVQGQMLVLGNRNYCDFYIWSKNEQKICRVEKNYSFCQNMLVQLKNVFTLKILPEVLTRSMMPNYDNPNRKYCVCGRPSFEPMIACDSSKCQFEWFHFGCVQILKAPKGKWFCTDCERKTDQ